MGEVKITGSPVAYKSAVEITTVHMDFDGSISRRVWPCDLPEGADPELWLRREDYLGGIRTKTGELTRRMPEFDRLAADRRWHVESVRHLWAVTPIDLRSSAITDKEQTNGK